MRRLAILLLLLVPAGRVRATVRCSPRRSAIFPPRRLATRTRRTAPRRATTRAATSSRRCSRPGRSARVVAALRADLLARGRAQVARAEALDRDDGFRERGAARALAGGPRARRPAASGCRRSRGGWQAAAADVERRRRRLGARARHRPLRRAIRRTRASRRRRPSSSARSSPGCASHRAPSGAAGGTTCARSASGRPTSPRTGSPARLGYGAIADGLRRLGMTSSTYPGPYRATTALAAPGTAHARDDRAATSAARSTASTPARTATPGRSRLLGLTRPAGGRRAPRARLGAARRGQRRPAPPWLGGVDGRGEERLALRHTHDRGDRLPAAAARRSSSSSSTGRASPTREAKRLGRRVLLAAGLLLTTPAAFAASPSSACFSSW